MCGVVVCKDNDKVGRCGSGVTGVVGCGDDRLVCVCDMDKIKGIRN